MTLNFLRSKFGIALTVLLVCGTFLAISKLKASARENRTAPANLSLDNAAVAPAAQGVSLLRKVEESARGRGEEARNVRQMARRGGDGYDDAGNPFRHRPIPEPMETHLDRNLENGGPSIPAADPDGASVPMLRIHGRRNATVENLAAKLGTTLNGVLPKTGADSPTGVPVRSRPNRPERFVPFGRLIKAELVITLESTQDEMPLVGLIVEPVYNNGKLVIPAGTELHSMARPDRIRDRILSTTVWRMVFPREGRKPNGRQLTFDGIALDREDSDGNGFTWGLDDGSYGLRGRAIHNGQTEQTLMIFAAEAIKAVGGSTMDRQTTLLGPQLDTSARNAGIAGGQAVLTRVAANIEKELERNGVYIQVPAGKEFYVYPRQVIDPDRADIPENIAKVE